MVIKRTVIRFSTRVYKISHLSSSSIEIIHVNDTPRSWISSASNPRNVCQLQYVINHQLRIDGNCGRLSVYSIERGVLKNEIFQIRARTFIIMPFLFNFFFGYFTTEISFVLFSSHPTLFLLTALIRASTFKNRNI